MSSRPIQEEYLAFNPWWQEDGEVSQIDEYDEFQRSDFEYHLETVTDHQVTILSGPVGVGKTRQLMHVADHLISNNLNRTKIFYLPLNEPTLKIGGEESIVEAVRWFNSSIIQPSLTEGNKSYLLIDDAHLVSNWVEQIGDVVSRNPELKVVATAPTEEVDENPLESSQVSYDKEVLLLEKFHDQASREYETLSSDNIKNQIYSARDSLGSISDPETAEEAHKILNRIRSNLEDIEADLQSSVRTYATHGAIESRESTRPKQDLELSVYRDIPQFDQIENKSDLHGLCALAAQHSGDTIKLSYISDALLCDRRTLQRYLEALKDFFILTPSYQHGYERHRRIKLYPRDPAQLVSLGNLTTRGPFLSAETKKKTYSTVLFDHCKRLSYYLNDYEDKPVSFWGSDDQAVDYVLTTAERELPVSLAIDRSREMARRGLRKFFNEFECSGGIVLSEDTDISVDESIIHLPIWLFLSIC